MAISRGSIHHNIKENLIALFLSFFSKSSCEEASEKITFKTTKKIKTFFGSSEAVLFPYARTSLFALLKSLNIPKGSQILMTPFNIFPMIDVIKNLELRPLFIDINLKDFGPDYSKLEFLYKLSNFYLKLSKSAENIFLSPINPRFIFKSFLKKKKLPIYLKDPNLNYKYNKNLRDWNLKINSKNYFENTVIKILSNILPRSVLEGYSTNKQLIKKIIHVIIN